MHIWARLNPIEQLHDMFLGYKFTWVNISAITKDHPRKLGWAN